MKRVLSVCMLAAGLMFLAACGGGSGNGSGSSQSNKVMDEIGKTTDNRIVMKSSVTSYEDDKFFVYDFSESGAEGIDTYLNYLIFPDKESYDQWQNSKRAQFIDGKVNTAVKEDRDGLLVIYRTTLGYKQTYQDVMNDKPGSLVK